MNGLLNYPTDLNVSVPNSTKTDELHRWFEDGHGHKAVGINQLPHQLLEIFQRNFVGKIWEGI